MLCRDETLKELLEDFKLYAGLSLHWVLVGPNGREYRPGNGGVLRYYTRCQKRPEPTVKTIANTWFLESADRHPHNLRFKCVAPLLLVT